MRINTNVASLQAMDANRNTNAELGSSLEKLSTGLRINKAADDGSGLAIADKLRTQATSIGQSIDNANSAIALTQIADKAMAEQSNIIDTVKAKMLQAATSTTSAEGRAAILNDVSKLLDQLDNIANNTNYNGTTLLNGDSFTFQVGESSTSNIQLDVTEAANSGSLGTAARGTGTLTASAQDSFGTTGNAVMSSTIAGTVATIEVGDTFRFKVEDKDTGDVEIYSYSVSQSDIDTHSAGSTTLITAIANGLIAEAAAGSMGTIAHGAAAVITFTSSTGNLTEMSTDTGATLSSMHSDALTNGLTAAAAAEFADVADGALNDLNTIRSEFGSTQNQLSSSVRNMQTTYTNLKAAESVIRDVDYAAESANFNRQNIIAQAGTYAMSQANAVSQNVLRLLQ
jgi:flagellin